jgi:hypothetical protein
MEDKKGAAVDFEVLAGKLPAAIASLRSLAAIETWLKSQPGVRAVQLGDYLLKSNPPQRDFIIEAQTADGATVRKTIHVFELGEQQFQFHQLRDA